MMKTFTDQQQKAKSLPHRLLMPAVSKVTFFGGLIKAASAPVIHSQDYQYAKLIAAVADGLDLFEVDNMHIKYRALLATHLYVLDRIKEQSSLFTESRLQKLCWDDWMVLDEVLGSPALIAKCFNDLNLFCNWVCSNRSVAEIDALYQQFPTDMQLKIHTQMHPVVDDKQSDDCLLFTLLEKVGEIGVFWKS